jgi:hypothetical protein
MEISGTIYLTLVIAAMVVFMIGVAYAGSTSSKR